MRSLFSRAAGVCLLIVSAASPAFAQPESVDVRIAALLDQVSDERLTQILATPPTFGTRNTLSSTDLPARGIEFDATFVFIALAGEEQGLIGARLHAQKAAADKIRIDAVLNNDVVFGVAALGADGSESLVSAYVNPPRAESVVKVK